MSDKASAVRCRLCDNHDKVPVTKPDGEDSYILVCPNCDNPKGILPPSVPT